MISLSVGTRWTGAASLPAAQATLRICGKVPAASSAKVNHWQVRRRYLPARSSSTDDSAPAPMPADEAAALLEVGMDASFDEIVAAKNSKLSDGEDVRKVEGSYCFGLIIIKGLQRSMLLSRSVRRHSRSVSYVELISL